MIDKAIYAKAPYNPDIKKPGFYRARRDTIVRVVDNKLFTGVVVVDDVPLDIEEGIHEIKIPRIPSEVIKTVLNFFRYVYTEYKSESVILTWYNFKTDEWSIEVPEQTVSTASIDYERDPNDEINLRARGFTFVGTIHSHGEMPAFHSGTDDDDEFNFDGLHITFGKIISDLEFACRFVMKDVQLKQEPEDVMELPESTNDVDPEWIKRVKKTTYGYKPFKNSSLLDDLDDDDDVNDHYNDWYSKKLQDQIDFNKKLVE